MTTTRSWPAGANQRSPSPPPPTWSTRSSWTAGAARREGRRHLDPARVTAYYELHIEQGPVLEHEGLPVGIVTGIRGNVRAREGRCIGRYDHAGGTPRKLRRDAVMVLSV